MKKGLKGLLILVILLAGCAAGKKALIPVARDRNQKVYPERYWITETKEGARVSVRYLPLNELKRIEGTPFTYGTAPAERLVTVFSISIKNLSGENINPDCRSISLLDEEGNISPYFYGITAFKDEYAEHIIKVEEGLAVELLDRPRYRPDYRKIIKKWRAYKRVMLIGGVIYPGGRRKGHLAFKKLPKKTEKITLVIPIRIDRKRLEFKFNFQKGPILKERREEK